MISILLVGYFTLLFVISVRTTNFNQSLRDNVLEIESFNSHSNHQARFFPLFSVVRFPNSECLSSIDQLNGTCFTRRECINYGGNPSGSCANRLGTCCVLYIDFNGATPITISVDTNADFVFDRRWNIRIQQIACNSVCRAPNGCLQYYKTVSGTVMSFNFGTTENVRAPQIGTRQMVNHRYGVCVRMALGYCNIEWSQVDTLSFSVSGDTGSFDPDIIGTALVAESGINCTTDFVIIPDPRENGVADNTDRFCGNGFITKTSDLKPFVLYVVTNGDEMQEVQNKGFALTFRQLPCAI
ncbi:hypothetical protein ALC62_00512 [Cyphomyrmex costatus]|uniref:CUB domain-containing protein n=1 Tax=Cyphomyrmex costatus TaxID=456900 RepID=A0A195D6M7_9HYME|nr:hypothetical protein ALC62_00512 [Cyphomyrmex costatus]